MKKLQVVVAIWISAWAGVVQADRKVEEHIASNHFNGKLEIDAAQGTLDIVGWDKNEVEIMGSLGDAVDRLEIDKGHRKIKVKAVVPKSGVGGEVHLVLHAPHNNDIRVPFFQGPVNISGIEGDIEVETLGGNISVIGSCKRVDARSVGGSITLDAAARGFAAEKVRAKTVSGMITLRKVHREAEIESISGPVTVVGDSFEKVTIETVSGEVRFEGGLMHYGRLQVDTHGGQILAAFPPEFSAEFDVATYHGKVENAFTSKADDKHSLPHADGNAQAEVKATSFSGNIRLTKMSKDQASTTQSGERLVKRE